MTTKQEYEAFRGHRLWVLADLTAKMASEVSGRSADDRHTLARVIAVAKYIKSYRPVEPYLFMANRLNEAEAISTFLDQINGQLSGWDSSAAMLPATAKVVDQYCDQALTHIADSKWPSARKGREADAFAEAADAYRVAADSSLSGIEKDIIDASNRLEQLEAKARDLAAESETREAEATVALATIAEVQAAQATNAQASLQIELKRINDAAEAQRKELLAASEVLLASLRQNEEAGNDLVKMVADQTTGGGYLQFANKEKRAHTTWNCIGGAAGLVAFVYLALFVGERTLTVDASILKVGVSLTLVALSVYAFREAGKRQKQSVEARYRALDVIAMPPFTQGLPVPEQLELRMLMGSRLFGATAEPAPTGKSRLNSRSVSVSLDENAVKAITEIVRAAGVAQN